VAFSVDTALHVIHIRRKKIANNGAQAAHGRQADYDDDNTH